MIDKSELLRVPVFADLPDDQLAWFLSQTLDVYLKAGEIYMRVGEPCRFMVVVLDGTLQVRGEINGETITFDIKAGTVTGVLPFSRMKQFALTGRAITDSHVLRFPASLFPELVQRMPELTQRLVGLMSDRIRETTRIEQQKDRLAGSGKAFCGSCARTQQSCFRRQARHQPVARNSEKDPGCQSRAGKARPHSGAESGDRETGSVVRAAGRISAGCAGHQRSRRSD